MFAKMRYLKAYEAKHLKAHEPARHLKAHEPAKHLKAADASKTPAWAVVIAGTGVAVTLVGATTGQFQGTIKTNQGAVPGKSTSRSAVRQLLKRYEQSQNGICNRQAQYELCGPPGTKWSRHATGYPGQDVDVHLQRECQSHRAFAGSRA